MTAEQQLERSVLEGKERDELQAIAQAMSLKTTSRTKKADIIDQILKATGVIGADDAGDGKAGSTNGAPAANGGAPAARRSRAASTAAVEAGDGGGSPNGSGAPTGGETVAVAEQAGRPAVGAGAGV